jgi:hypothetical protein
MQAAIWTTACGITTAVGGVLASSAPEYHILAGWRKGLRWSMPTTAVAIVFFALAFYSIRSL